MIPRGCTRGPVKYRRCTRTTLDRPWPARARRAYLSGPLEGDREASEHGGRGRPANHHTGHRRPGHRRVGQARRRRAVRQRRRPGPGGVSQRRAVPGAGGGGRRQQPRPPGDHGGDRAAAQHRAARQAGRLPGPAQRRAAAGVRQRRRQGVGGLAGPGAAGPAVAVGAGLLRPRRRRRRRRLPARLLRLHRPVRRADRGRQLGQRPRREGLRPRLPGGRLRPSGAAADRVRPRPARPAGRRARLTGEPAMRIGVLGGGPAGLYFALLAKRADPSHEVTVVERNAPDATFGWGVVFSEETLGALRDADHPSFVEISDAFARWSAIDVVYGGRTVRSRGHVFSAIARKRLLEILQRRCRDVGVELAFHTDVPGLDAFAGSDLVVAADGVNSTARRLLAEQLRPTLDVHRSRYVWFGTDLVLDAFTFVFRATEHGMFQVHAYPFDAHTSTFIVECTEATWRRAGLEDAGEEESIAFCQELFAPELAGHELLSNRSLWTSFVTVRCTSWHHGDVVLLGDAAHTAHFTIGSGTKLAMEDAVALSGALQRHSGERLAAMTDYELERQPLVERFQEAARASATWFEDVRRYDGFDPVQFAFNLLTRSGRIGHLELTKRDARFVATVDRFLAGTPAALIPRPPLLTPLRQREVTISNRVAVAVVGEDDADQGELAEAAERRHLDAAAAGPGVVVSELVAVAPDGRVSPGTPGLWEESHAAPWARVAAAARRRGSRLAVRVGHAGRRGATRPRRHGVDRPLAGGGWPLLAASAIPYGRGSATPRAMRRADMERV